MMFIVYNYNIFFWIFLPLPHLFSLCNLLFRLPPFILQKAVYIPPHSVVFPNLLFEFAVANVLNMKKSVRRKWIIEFIRTPPPPSRGKKYRWKFIEPACMTEWTVFKAALLSWQDCNTFSFSLDGFGGFWWGVGALWAERRKVYADKSKKQIEAKPMQVCLKSVR